MSNRDCKSCIHYQQGKGGVYSCTIWECNYEKDVLIRRSEVLDLLTITDPNYEIEDLKEDIECLNSIDINKNASILEDVRNEIKKLIDENIDFNGMPNEYAYCYQSVLEIIDKRIIDGYLRAKEGKDGDID